MQNVFPPGYQAAEPEIAQQLGMSRTPVHEAIIRLQEEGLVQVLSRRGVVVCAVAPSDIREIYDVTIALEGMAASLLAQQAPDVRPQAAAAPKRETESMAAVLANGDLLGWAATDDRFHKLLTEQCGNRRLARMASTVMDQSHRARLLTLHLRPPPVASAAEHRQIIDAIRQGDFRRRGDRGEAAPNPRPRRPDAAAGAIRHAQSVKVQSGPPKRFASRVVDSGITTKHSSLLPTGSASTAV